jgi:hypothetical protein
MGYTCDKYKIVELFVVQNSRLCVQNWLYWGYGGPYATCHGHKLQIRHRSADEQHDLLHSDTDSILKQVSKAARRDAGATCLSQYGFKQNGYGTSTSTSTGIDTSTGTSISTATTTTTTTTNNNNTN